MPNLPSRTFDSALEFRWLGQVRPWLGVDLAVAPGYYSDFDQSSSKAIRITGRGIAQLSWSPTVRWLLGVVYLDRRDVGLLPVGGLIWTPRETIRWELIVPRPRIAYRIAVTPPAEWWTYVGGEFGGGNWAYSRVDGSVDEFSYRDFRLLLGIERKTAAGINGLFEVGYVFEREIELASDPADFEPDDTLLLRGGFHF